MNHDVFISYSSKNKTTALAICHVLEQHRIKCWMAPRDIPPGADYGDVIDEAIMACRVFVIIFSEPASVSQWVKGELNLAFTEEKHIVPYRIDETKLKGAMRLILNQTHWIEAYPDAESKFDELVSGIARYLNIPAPASRPAPESVSELAPEPVLEPVPEPAPQPVSQPVPQPVKTYKVGDYYNENGKEGVVFEVDATGHHGKIVGMKQSAKGLQWCTNEEYERKIATRATNLTDGMKNMRAIRRISGWREKYPAFAWCAEQGDGWYLPAIEELKKFTSDASIYNAVNRTLSQRGGMALLKKRVWNDYWSSSEKMYWCAWRVPMFTGNMCDFVKSTNYYVRAVSAF